MTDRLDENERLVETLERITRERASFLAERNEARGRLADLDWAGNDCALDVEEVTE